MNFKNWVFYVLFIVLFNMQAGKRVIESIDVKPEQIHVTIAGVTHFPIKDESDFPWENEKVKISFEESDSKEPINPQYFFYNKKNINYSLLSMGIVFTASYIATMSYFYYKTIKLKRLIWSYWRLDVPVPALAEIPYKVLQDELISDAKIYYAMGHDKLTAQLILDLNKEIDICKNVINLCEKLSLIKINLLIPGFDTIKKTAHISLQKLLILKSSFYE